jgi:hypothetical protein
MILKIKFKKTTDYGIYEQIFHFINYSNYDYYAYFTLNQIVSPTHTHTHKYIFTFHIVTMNASIIMPILMSIFINIQL